MTQMNDNEALEEAEAHGWLAIDNALQPIYGDQEPLHYGTAPSFRLGGNNPLDGFSAYKSEVTIPHWHFVSYGMSELYEKETDDPEINGFGFEFTFRLTRTADEEEPPGWVFSYFQHLARYVFETGKAFDVGHRMDSGKPILLEPPTEIHAIAFTLDPQLGEIETPYGHLKFLQIVGVTKDELQTMKQWTTAEFLSLLAEDNPYS